MSLNNFAATHHLRLKRDQCGDTFIPGTSGHIFDGYNSGLGVYVSPCSVRGWTFARRAMESAGMTIRQNGDDEGIAVFDPTNAEQARLAIRLTHARVRRMPAPPTSAQLAARAKFADRQRNIPKAA